MNQKHLLRFIKKALKNNADEVVTVTKGKFEIIDIYEEMKIEFFDFRKTNVIIRCIPVYEFNSIWFDCWYAWRACGMLKLKKLKKLSWF